MASIFITGIQGFIGSHLAKKMREEGHKVIGLVRDYHSTKWLKEALKGSIRVRGDVTNFRILKRALNQYQIDWCIHLAAMSIVKTAHRDPIGTFSTNVMGTVKLLEACRQLEIKKLVIQSTDKVYGNLMDATTSSPLKPTEIYGTSKCCIDFAAQTFIETYGMSIAISRMCNVYGFDKENRIIPNTIRNCLHNQSPVIFKNDTSKRQYIHINDACAALKFLSENDWTKGVYNIATNNILNQEEVVLKILKFFPALKPRYIEKPKLKQIESQSMHPTTYPPYWEPKVTFEEGIKQTIDDFRRYGY